MYIPDSNTFTGTVQCKQHRQQHKFSFLCIQLIYGNVKFAFNPDSFKRVERTQGGICAFPGTGFYILLGILARAATLAVMLKTSVYVTKT